ncbi:MAG: nitroreductase family deazaflavin-dependent oxidoreductase [Nakamurella sp.]
MPNIVDLVRYAIAPLTRTVVFRRYAPRILPVLEAVASFVSRGRLQVAGLLVPALELHTVGAKTGVTRSTRLMYLPDGPGRAIVAGSNFGRACHPGWTANLRAHPDAEIVVSGRTIRVRATEIGDAERDAIWARIESQWPGYRSYERGSGRTVRLFRLGAVWKL